MTYRDAPTATVALMPETWWQHFKLALRERWPRVFRRLIVRWSPARKMTFTATLDGLHAVEYVEDVN